MHLCVYMYFNYASLSFVPFILMCSTLALS